MGLTIAAMITSIYCSGSRFYFPHIGLIVSNRWSLWSGRETGYGERWGDTALLARFSYWSAIWSDGVWSRPMSCHWTDCGYYRQPYFHSHCILQAEIRTKIPLHSALRGFNFRNMAQKNKREESSEAERITSETGTGLYWLAAFALGAAILYMLVNVNFGNQKLFYMLWRVSEPQSWLPCWLPLCHRRCIHCVSVHYQ